jgi:Type II CAAX prenyl endopeptidase Rce1-like
MAFARWLTQPVNNDRKSVLKFAAIVTAFAACTEILASWAVGDVNVYFFYEGAEKDFYEFSAFSSFALIAFPFGEELVFRGPLALVRKYSREGTALVWITVLSAAFFGLIHGGLMPQMASAIFFSAVFLRTLKLHDSFWRGILLAGLTHLVSNIALLMMQLCWNDVLVPMLS